MVPKSGFMCPLPPDIWDLAGGVLCVLILSLPPGTSRQLESFGLLSLIPGAQPLWAQWNIVLTVSEASEEEASREAGWEGQGQK